MRRLILSALVGAAFSAAVYGLSRLSERYPGEICIVSAPVDDKREKVCYNTNRQGQTPPPDTAKE